MSARSAPERVATKAEIRPRPGRVARLAVAATSLLCASLAALLPRGASGRDPLVAVTPPTGAPVWVAPAEGAAPTARIAFLHGMCMDAHRTCARILPLAAGRGALACPTGNGACGGGADWRGDGEAKARHLEVALAAAWPRSAEEAEASAPVLVGFSRGAFVARDVALARPGAHRALVLLGASLRPDPGALRAAGIERVVLGAGDFDPARATMQRAAAELRAGGLPARYVSLGPIGHALPRDVEARLGEALMWALAR